MFRPVKGVAETRIHPTTMKIHHLNAGILQAAGSPAASCHCLLIELGERLVLVDTGIGLDDIRRPFERIGREAIEAAGFQFHEQLTLARQVERLGFKIDQVGDIVLTHGDPDHAGGLADFPHATVHLAVEEHSAIQRGGGRYSEAQFSHGPRWKPRAPSSDRWYGLESRSLDVAEGVDLRLIPLFGHTLGHCGVAVRNEKRWLLHVGDAYYLRVELATDLHPVSVLAAQRAEDDALRRASLASLRELARQHGAEVEMFGYHDFQEFRASPEPSRSSDGRPVAPA